MTNMKTFLLVLLASVIIVGVAAVAFRYSREISAARKQIDRLGSQVIETACGPIEYARVGDGYPVLVVHGALGGFDQGLLTARQLIEAGFQVISVSRFGYLRSPIPENATLDLQVDLYACLLDELGIRQAAVLGVSAGATSAIRFAARYPERVSALILQSPASPGKVEAAPPPAAAFTLMRSDFAYWAMVTSIRPVVERMVGVPAGFRLTPETEAAVTGLLAATLPSSGRIDGFLNDFVFQTSEFNAEISAASPYSVYKIHTPVLVIAALDDPLAVHENVRGMAEKFPNARLYVVPDSGHLLLGHSTEVDAEITRFLRSGAAALNTGS